MLNERTWIARRLGIYPNAVQEAERRAIRKLWRMQLPSVLARRHANTAPVETARRETPG